MAGKQNDRQGDKRPGQAGKHRDQMKGGMAAAFTWVQCSMIAKMMNCF
jgi:hypothetical protein